MIVTGLPVQSQPQGIVGCAIKEDGGLKTCVCFPVWNPPASRTSLVFRHYRWEFLKAFSSNTGQERYGKKAAVKLYYNHSRDYVNFDDSKPFVDHDEF